jgi:predicted nucleotidyltransferase
MRVVRWLCALSLAALLAGGCGGEDAGPCTGTANPGALVITEVMIDPAGPDPGNEWVEIANVSGVPQCLNGLYFEAAGATLRQSFLEDEEDLVILPGSYAVVGATFAPDPLAWLEPDFDLANTAATLYLKRGELVIDSMRYGGETGLVAKEGRALALCAECLDVGCNDDPDWWGIASGAPYDAAGNRGSPGIPNGSCACPAPPGTTGVRPPNPGDLLITEIFANPGGTDGDREWFEVKVVAQDAAIDFSGIQILAQVGGNPVVTVSPDQCLAGSPGSYLVFGRSVQTGRNGGVSPDYAYGTLLTLPNEGGYVGLARDGELLAGYTYPAVTDGRSLSLDEESKEWCDGSMPFGDAGDFGTPGGPNPACGVATCLVGGAPVTAQVPMPGEVEIVEVFPNTPGKEIPEREWFEVRVAGSREIDLNGLEIHNDPEAIHAVHTIQPTDGRCLRVQPGGYVLLARSAVASLNGLPAGSIVYVYGGLSMQSADYLGLHYAGNVIASAEWLDCQDGRALQKDVATGDWCDATKSYWTTPENKMAFGTPGSPNQPCAGGSTCLANGSPRLLVLPAAGELVINEVFANPDGNDSANREWLELYVDPAAIGKDLNGIELFVKGESKGTIGDGSEACITIEESFLVVGKTADAGRSGGAQVDIVLPGFALANSDVSLSLSRGQTLFDFAYYTDPDDGVALQLDPDFLDSSANDSPDHWCNAKVPFNSTPELGTPGAENPSCSAEFCTQGGNAVQLKKFYPDELVITEIYANPKGSDDDKEWFEVYVTPGASAAHLNGIGIMKKVGAEPDWYFTTTVCIELKPGQHYVLCRSDDPAKNGGITDCIPYGSVTLVNSGGVLGLGKPGVIYDLVASYGDAEDGISRMLDGGKTTATANDSKDNWCDTPANYTFADGRGTPGQPNPVCP